MATSQRGRGRWGFSLRGQQGTCVTSQGPLHMRSSPPLSTPSGRAEDTFSMSMTIINFKKFKSIHFSLKFEVCKGMRKEGSGNSQPAGRVLLVTSFPIM